MIDPLWTEKLTILVEKDHFTRDALLKRGILSDDYHPEMEKVHLANAKVLQELIRKHGFPTLSTAGEDGVRLSWLIIHHSISLPDFMKECLLEMRLAAATKDYPLDLIAYTDDRIAYFEGRKQLYGTNLDWQDGELKHTPIEDEGMVNVRRRGMGLPPLKKDMPVTEDRPPKDPIGKEKKFQQWLQKVGWR